MSKQIKIDLTFDAKTEQAKGAILDLKENLAEIAKLPGKSTELFDDKSVRDASKAAMDLQKHLDKAVNVKTGKLDLSRFSISLKAAGKDLNKYYDDLIQIGPQGQKAFMQLAQSVATAEAPIVRINKRMEEMKTVLQNTIKWQISSSILHGFMSSMSSAYRYAQHLNESLNNIRIVTGQSAEQMARFAVEANRSAKALSTTTNEYAKASLIYYQQGLSESEVKEKTDITIKMANVARQSAEVVSDQMTAVWNNFDDGSRSLEFYADAMTALGAATASSTAEISEGLNKFAAIADTVGLSYEYATSALATVTSQTRQSADIVGTAFKTIFARIQGLEFGKTLEDGTTFNKYSEALHMVGIDIKDSSGQLKDMDHILEEMASRWEEISKDQQVALAQTVAGTRQYTQLVALMDNWDFMESNLQIVKESSGALQEQQEIYAESWEAASDRVRASIESIYHDLLDDNFFVFMLNGFADISEGIHGVTESLGGMKGIAMLVGSIFMKIYSRNIPDALENLKSNFIVLTGQSKKYMDQARVTTAQKLEELRNDPKRTDEEKTQIEGALRVSQMKEELLNASRLLTDSEKEEYQAKIDNTQAMYEEAAALAKLKKEKEKALQDTQKGLKNVGVRYFEKIISEYQSAQDASKSFETQAKNTDLSDEEQEFYKNRAADQQKKAFRLRDETQELLKRYGYAKTLTPDDAFVQYNGSLSGEVRKRILKDSKDDFQIINKEITKSSVLTDTKDALAGQAQQWANIAKSSSLSKKSIDETRQSMIEYLNIVKEITKTQIGDKLFPRGHGKKDMRPIDNIIQKLESTTELSQEELQQISTQIEAMSGRYTDIIEDKILKSQEITETAKNRLIQSGYTEEQLSEFERVIEQAAQEAADYNIALSNINKTSEEIPEPTFKISSALMQLGGAAMTTASMVETVKGAINTFADDSSSAAEKIGAATSVIIMGFNSWNSAMTLTESLMTNASISNWLTGNKLITSLGTSFNFATGAAMSFKAVCAEIFAVIALVATAIGGLTWAYKELSGANDLKRMKESTEAFKEQQEVVNNLKDELASLQERIDELSNKKSLTIVEQSELTKLQATEASLRAQLEIEKKMQQNAAKEVVKNTLDVYGNSSHNNNQLYNKTGETYAAQINSQNVATRNNAYAALPQMNESGELAIYDKDGQKIIGYLSREIDNIQQLSEADRKDFAERAKADQESYDNVLSALETGIPLTASQQEQFNALKSTVEYNNKKISGENYEKDFLGAAFSLSNKFSYQDLQKDDGTIDWSKQVDKTVLDKLAITEDSYNQYVNEKISKLKDNISEDDFNKLNVKDLASIFNNIEAVDLKGPQSLQEYLHGIALDVELNNEKFTELKDNLIEIEKISKDMSVGKILTPEKYEILVQYNQELSKYFSLLSDGSAVFSGDLGAYHKDIKDLKQEALRGQIDKYNSVVKEKGQNDYSAALIAGTNTSINSFASDLLTETERSERQGLYDELAFSAEDTEERQKMYESGDINKDAYGKASALAMNKEAWDGIDVKQVEEYSEILQETNKHLKNNEQASQEVARTIIKMNKGVKTLSDNWEEWGSVLKNSSNDSEEWAKAINGTKKAVSDVLDVSEDFIDTDWLSTTENLDLIGKAAKGDEDAINSLGVSLAKDIAGDAIDSLYEKTRLSNAEASNMATEFITAIDEISQYIANTSLEPGEMLNNQGLIDELNEMVEATGMSVEAANAMYRSMGFTPEFETEPITTKSIIPITTTTHHREYTKGPDENGNMTDWVDTEYSTTEQKEAGEHIYNSLSMATKTLDGQMPQIPKPTVKKLTYSGGGRMNNKSSTNPGGKSKGGGSKPKKTKVSKKSDVVERYKEINDAIDDLTDALEDVNKQSDHLYGAEKLAKMAKVNKLLQEEIGLTKKKKKEAENYLKEDRKALEKAATAAGLEFHLVNGNIVNYKEQMTKLFNELYSAQTSANADGNATESEEEEIKKIQEKIDKVKDALKQYDETRELIEDLDNEIQDKLYEWQDKNFEILQYKLELKLEINQIDLDTLEYYMGKLENDFYKMAEAAGYLTQQYPIYEKNLAAQKEFYEQLTKDKNAGNITNEKYVEGLKSIRENILENLNSLQDLDQSVVDYYGNTLSAAGEEISKITEKMAHQTSVLEHYRNVIELLGKTSDYDSILTVLDSQIKVQENTVEAAKKEYQFYREQADTKKTEMDKAYVEGNQALGDLLKEQWEIAESTAQEAQDRLLSETEAWGEQITERLSISLEKAAKELNKALAGEHFNSLEEMVESLERASSLQEEYLTSTNKIYETDKLMRAAQKNLDISNNTLAKNKLKNFIKETEALQEQGRLSEYELNIQQAKYELLLAEIALEESQNASKVQLSRDEFGNFSYIYTADAQKVSEAEQKYKDAENNLYNIALEGANKYAEQKVQLLNELAEKMAELDQKHQEVGTLNTAEYEAEKAEITEYYMQKLKDAQELYNIAIRTDNRATTDAWSSDIQGMITDSASWEEALKKHAESVDSAFKEWETDMDKIANETVGPNLDSLKDKVGNITDASEDLKDSLVKKDGVIDSLNVVTESVNKQLAAYGNLRSEIQATIETYEKFYGTISDKVKNENNPSKPVKPDPKDEHSIIGGKQPVKPKPEKKLSIDDKVVVKESASKFADGSYMQDWVPGHAFKVKQISAGGKEVLIGDPSGGSRGYTGWVYKKDLKGFETGGYTGSWGKGGKLALLHEKEIVLNAKDSSNLMKTIMFTRDIINTIETNAKSFISNLQALISHPAQDVIDKKAQELKQNVTIEAHFPAVTSQQEIEAALMDLTLGASQYINRY